MAMKPVLNWKVATVVVFGLLLFPPILLSMLVILSRHLLCVVKPFFNDTWIWNWNRQSIGSHVVALNAMISEIWHISFYNGPDTWSWKISYDDTFSVQATRSHIDNCLLPSLHPNSRWSNFLPRKLWNLMIMFSSNVIRLLTFGALFARGQTSICLPSLLAHIGCNGLRIGELLKSLKTLCMPFLRLLYGSYEGTAIAPEPSHDFRWP
ncbi:hypothetical protein Tco_0908440 [Tanacetum coccineum]|uniref:Uncharacterized protein n=1 Tax=Tanacetum coccineum TaxID=301880 RepID=A0ABQ5CN88_9ASTR